jgi:hypothetical protein
MLQESPGVVLQYSIFLVHQLNRMLKIEKNFLKFQRRGWHHPSGVRTSKLNRSSARSKMTFSWITEQDRYMKAWVRSWWHGLNVERHHVGYLLEISDTRAILGQMADVYETATIWLDGRRELRGTLSWEWTMCKHYLGKSSRDVKQTRKHSCSSSLREVVDLGPESDLL